MNHQNLTQYFEMVADRTRSDAFERAIAKSVAGKVVLDLGSGPGFLSHLALKHGARKVYAIDGDSQALALATALARRFPNPERFVPVHGYSLDIDLAEQVDVIVSETLDSNGVGENVHVVISDAARRFLAPGGIVIPSKLDLFLGLGESAEARSLGRAWEEAGGEYGLPYQGFDHLLAGIPMIVNCPDVLTGGVSTGEPEWVPWQTIDLIKNDFRLHTVVPMQAVRPGMVRGVAIAWCAHLTDEIRLSSLPSAPGTHWKQGFFNLSAAVEAEAGDQFIFEIRFSDSRQPGVAYEMRVHHARAANREQFIASLPDGIRASIASGRVATIEGSKL